jgi:PhnB protein
MMTHGQGPNAANLPAEQKHAILHARIEIGNTVIMGADIPKSEPMRSAYLTLTVGSEKEAERLYTVLSEGGQIFMKMEKTSSRIVLRCFDRYDAPAAYYFATPAIP